MATHESVLGQEGGQSVLFKQIDGGVVRSLDEAAVRVPEWSRKQRVVGLAARQGAPHVARHELHVLLAVIHVQDQTVERFAVQAIERRVPGMTAKMHVIARRIAGSTLETEQLPSRHLALIVDEDRLKVSQNEVGVVTQIKVDVDAKPASGIGVEHVGSSAHGREHRHIGIVRGVQVHVELGRGGVVRRGVFSALSTESRIAGLKRQLGRNGILSASSERSGSPLELTHGTAAAGHGICDHCQQTHVSVIGVHDFSCRETDRN
ncbi:MAG: hypothetical protein JW384_01983 [Nitrosomonadaceae bacterium]|nr:hypothetical protein [Nitrosomonadaceae bacterium]